MKQRSLTPLVLPLLAPFIVTGCAQLDALRADEPASVDSAYLEYAEDDAQAAVESARMEVSRRRDNLAAAELRLADAENLRDLAREQVDVVEERLELAEARVDSAHTPNVQSASLKLADRREDELSTSQNRVDIYDALCLARKMDIERAEARVDLAQSRVQLELARAIQGVKRTDRPDVNVSDYRVDVREKELEVELAQTRYDAAVREVKLVRELHENSGQLFPEMTREIDALLASSDAE